MSTSKQLREERASIVERAQALLRKPGFNGEDRVKFDRAMADADVLRGRIDAIESAAAQQVELQNMERSGVDRLGARYESASDREYRMQFNTFLRTGEVSERMKARRSESRAAGDQAAGTQAISYTAGAAGGYLVAPGFSNEVDVATKWFCRMMDGNVCRILETATGGILPYPTSNDTAHVAAVLAENTQETEDPLTMGLKNLGAFKYSSRLIRVSLELLQDSAFDIEDFVKRQFAERFGRAYEAVFTNGDGNNKPTGFIKEIEESGATTLVAAGANPNSGIAGDTGANSIGTQDLVALEHSIDPSYRQGAKWMLNDDTVRELKSLLDKFGKPIWLPGLAVNAPDSILGYPYVINQAMDKIGAGKKTVAFGDWQKFVIRKVRELAVVRLTERFADYGQVAFIGFSRVDSRLIDAGVHPLNYMKQAS